MVTTGLVLGLVTVLVMNYAYPEIHAWLVAVFIKKRLLTGSIMLGGGACWANFLNHLCSSGQWF